MTKTKTCIHCNKSKKLTSYYAHPMMNDGRLGSCKECCKTRNRANRLKNVRYYREYDKERWHGDAKRRADMVVRVAAWNQKHPEQQLARQKVGDAVRSGKLIRPQRCGCCWAKGRVHGHHEDYSKPLVVDWLCSPCHSARHKEISSHA